MNVCLWNARARNGHVEATLNHPFPAQVSLRRLETKCTKDALTHGTLTEDKDRALEEARKKREKLLAHVLVLGDCLDRDAPDLPEVEDEPPEDALASLSLYGGAKLSLDAGPFDDETARTFYEDYPNVLDVVPPPVLGLSEGDVLRLQQERADAKALWKGATLTDLDAKEAPPSSSSSKEDVLPPQTSPDDDGDERKSELLNSGEDAAAKPGDVVGRLLTEDLPAVFNRERADALALAFCEGHATKGARKRLVRALFAVPRTALELVPQYARIAAVVSQAFKDVGTLLVAELLSEFRWLQRKKGQHNLETKMRNIRFVGELVKFRVAPPHAAFHCLKVCAEDFSHHAVDVACALLEVAGGFLLRSPPTSSRTAQFLDVVMKLKTAKPLNARDAALVDNAWRSRAATRRPFNMTPSREWVDPWRGDDRPSNHEPKNDSGTTGTTRAAPRRSSSARPRPGAISTSTSAGSSSRSSRGPAPTANSPSASASKRSSASSGSSPGTRKAAATASSRR